MFSLQRGGDFDKTGDRPGCLFRVAECGEAEVALPVSAEAYPGGADDGSFVEQQVEVLPRSHTLGTLHPYIRRIDAAGVTDMLGGESFVHDACVGHIILHAFTALFSPLLPSAEAAARWTT